jgi:hypothetical protein
MMWKRNARVRLMLLLVGILLAGAPVAYTGDTHADVQARITVRAHATSGDGTRAQPWAGWETAFRSAPARSQNPEILFAYYFDEGYYLQTSPITISRDRTRVRGAGADTTFITFAPGANATAFTFDAGDGSVLYQCEISSFAIYAPTDTTHTKIAIKLVDTSEQLIQYLSVGRGNTWRGRTSIGIETHGREAGLVSRTTVYADIPLYIRARYKGGSLDLDHFVFRDMYLQGSDGVSNPLIKIDGGLELTNITFDGYQAWVGGAHGLQWLDTTSVAVSSNISIANVRWEQSDNAKGYMIDIEKTGAAHVLQNLLLTNLYGVPNARGVKLNGIRSTVLKGVYYPGMSEALNITNVDELALIECFWQTFSTVSLTNMEQLFAPITPRASHAPIPYTAFYISSSNRHKEVRVNDVAHWAAKGKLANGAKLDIPMNGIQVTAVVTVGANGATKHEGGQALVTAENAYRLSGTTNFDVQNVPGKLTVFRESQSVITLFNQLGETIDYVVTFVRNP